MAAAAKLATGASGGAHRAGAWLEGAVGIWLLSGRAPLTARWVAVAMFSLFAGINGYKAANHYPTCGCFGRFEVSPVLTAALDTGVVIALMASRPSRPLSAGRSEWAGLVIGVAGGVAGMGLFPGPAAETNPSLRVESLAAGEWIAVRPGGRVEHTFWLANDTADPVTVAEAVTSCPCGRVALGGLVVAPASRSAVTVVIDMAGEPDFVGQMVLEVRLLDPAGVPVAVANLRLRVAGAR